MFSVKKNIKMLLVFAWNKQKYLLMRSEKNILIQRLNTIIFLTPLADISACFKQKLTTFLYFFTENNLS